MKNFEIISYIFYVQRVIIIIIIIIIIAKEVNHGLTRDV